MDKFDFRLHHPSVCAEAAEDLRYAESASPVQRKYGKPVLVWHTHGSNLIGVPQGLVDTLGSARMKKAQVFKSIHSMHIETENAFYLLRINSTSRLVLPEDTRS
jgi:hypothetical protein